LAKNFAKILEINYTKKVLIRKKNTRQQSKLNRQERLTNLDNSFKIKNSKLDNIDKKIIFLIDDVVTS
jgi:predicted amidophosphoribosyltransferase